MRSLRRLYVLVAGFVAAMVMVGLPVVIAQNSANPDDLGSGLNVSPTRYERTIQPGATDSITFSVKNPTNARVIASAVINDFVDEEGTGFPQIITDEERTDLPSIRPFIDPIEGIPIEPNETATVEVPIELPADTAAGGYYGVIRFQAAPDGTVSPEAGQVALNANVAPVVMITVPGNITEQVQLRNVLFYRKNVAGTFFTSRPDQLGVHIINQGNGFTKPFGTVRVSNPFGKEVINYALNSATPPSNILPNSERIFKTVKPNNVDSSTPQGVEVAGNVNLPGRYVATAEISFGDGGEVLILKKSFWYLPYWFIGVLLLLVALLVVAGFAIRRKVTTGSFKRRKK